MTSAEDRALELLRETKALLEGDFLLSSGRYAQKYVQCAQLLQHPDKAGEVCAMLAKRIKEANNNDRPYDVVVGPAMGAVTMGYELARAMGVRGIFAERKAEGGFQLRRGFSVRAEERVLVAEDVVTPAVRLKKCWRCSKKLGSPTWRWPRWSTVVGGKIHSAKGWITTP